MNTSFEPQNTFRNYLYYRKMNNHLHESTDNFISFILWKTDLRIMFLKECVRNEDLFHC